MEGKEDVPFLVRVYQQDKDDPHLNEIEALCSQGSVFPVAFDHGKDYCVRVKEHHITGEPTIVLVATERREGGSVCGMVSGAIKEMLFQSQIIRCGYAFSLRVHPHYRRKGIGNLLHSKLEEWFISNGARLSYGFLAEGNTASAQLFERNGFTKMAVPIQLLGMFVQNIAKEVPSYVLDQVKERADIEQAAQLIGEYWKGSAFVPFPEDLHKMLSSPHCFGPFIVSSQDGKSHAGLSVWRHTYGIKVLQVPWYVKWGLGAVNTLAGLLPSMVPSLPEVHKKKTT